MRMLRELHELLQGIGRPEICVVGDLMLDSYVWGEVSRVSPEAPIPVLKVTSKEHRPGGAASVAAMLADLGAHVWCVGAVGRDAAAKELAMHLKDLGVETSGLVACSDRPTIVKTRHLGFVQSAGRALQQIVRTDEEDCKPLIPEAAAAVVAHVQKALQKVDLVIVQDMSKGLFTPAMLREIIAAAKAARKPVVVDPELGDDYSRYAGATCILPNRYEAQQAAGVTLQTEDDYRSAGRKLLKELSLRAVVIKLDRDGMFLCTAEGTERRFGVETKAVADVTGAGDMVAATVALVLGAGGNYEQAVQLANIAAGLEVARHGAATISRSELLAEMSAALDPAARKLKSREEIAHTCRSLKEQGLRIAFTNGCFDLLHFGHVQLMRFARAQADVLIVGVNSDASVRELKGPGRPVNSVEVRTRILAALDDVDYVVVFDELSVHPLIEQIRPDVLVKGGDYGKEGVVGYEFVESYGGEVRLAPEAEGFSTTDLMRRISQNNEERNRSDTTSHQ